MSRGCGARVVAARSEQEALGLLDSQPITASILDVKLEGGTADDLCHQLSERKIPFVIYSGYNNVGRKPRRAAAIASPLGRGGFSIIDSSLSPISQ